ncbi:hypothetical protein J6590_053025 [Homalodisca vitripennis]|nr:hypothetical protein J6590_053025 [Homalodisca vitripennis]
MAGREASEPLPQVTSRPPHSAISNGGLSSYNVLIREYSGVDRQYQKFGDSGWLIYALMTVSSVSGGYMEHPQETFSGSGRLGYISTAARNAQSSHKPASDVDTELRARLTTDNTVMYAISLQSPSRAALHTREYRRVSVSVKWIITGLHEYDNKF